MENLNYDLVLGIIPPLIMCLAYTPTIVNLSKMKEIKLPIVTWVVFSLVNFVMLLSSYSAGGIQWGLLAFLVSFLGSTTVMFFVIFKSKNKNISFWDWLCGIAAVITLIFWLFIKQNEEFSEVALFIATFVNFLGIIPSIRNAWEKPWTDRPYLWFVFGLGFGMTVFVIPAWELRYYLVPLYMFFGCIPVWLPLIVYRIKNKIPLRQWV